MKTLLYLTAFPPCQKTGGQAFSVNAIKELSQKYEITLIFFSYPEHNCEFQPCENIKSVEKIQINKFDIFKHFWIHPIFTRRFNRSFLHHLQNMAQNYDIIYFDFSQVALYSLFINHPYKVLRMHDVLCQKFRRKNLLLAKWICKTEKKIVRSVEKVFVPSKKDAEIIEKNYGVKALFTNEYLKQIFFPAVLKQTNQYVFYGYWKRPENINGLIWFIENVIPLLKSEYTFLVIGGGLDSGLREKYLEQKKIKYIGFVDDPLSFIMQSSALIVPLFQGAGIKVKVIDSFTAGTPVIGTSLAFEGLPDMPCLSHYAESPENFAHILKAFKPITYEEKIKLAKQFNEIYNNHHLLEQIEDDVLEVSK